MAFAYLLDPTNQYQDRRGVNNVNGFFKVFRADTDDTATTYKDFNGTLNPERIPIDNNGRAVMIVETGRPYRVEMYLPNGSLEFTQSPIYPLASGGGLTMVNIESTDGSIKVDKHTSGGQATFDLSVNDADPQYLDWAKCALANVPEAGTMIPLKVQGTMDADEHGVVLKAGNLYHVTARFVATKTDVQPFYDNISLGFNTFDGEQSALIFGMNRIIDYSLGLNQEFDVSADIKVGEHDVSLFFTYSGQDVNAGEIRFLSADIHKLFSGVPQLPEGVASRQWVSENFQEKLEAGEGITIVGNVISATASQQQQADWAENDPADVTFIRNKPNLSTVATSGSYNDLSDKPSIPSPQVQSDWSEADNSKPDFIKNKPNLATVATSGSYNDLSDKPDIPSQQVQSDWTEADSSKPAFIKNKPNLSTVATSGSYNDLSDKPSIPAAQVQSDWNEADNSKPDFIKNKPNLSTVATSGSYNDLQDKPSIPDPQVQSDWNEADNSKPDFIKNKPSIPEGVPAYSTADADKVLGVVDNQGTAELDWVSKGGGGTQVQADWAEQDSADPSYIKNKPNLATVATSGSYNDLQDKPSIPAAQVQADWNEADNTKADYIKNKPAIPAAQVQSDWSQSDNTKVDYIKNKPNLATVATSGSYNDLQDKPSIPAAQVQSDWNQSDNSAVDFIKNKPTIPAAQVQSDWNQSDNGAVDYIKNKPTIPVVPPMKNLVAGTNVTITETANGVEIAASDTPQEQADWNEADNTKVDYIKNKPNLATVATSGSYNDLSDKPSIPAAQVQSDWNQSDNSAVDYIKNKPSIPAAQVQADWSQSDNTQVDYIKNKPGFVGADGVSVTFDSQNNRYVASLDETELWSGAGFKYGDSAVTLSEAASHFDRIRVETAYGSLFEFRGTATKILMAIAIEDVGSNPPKLASIYLQVDSTNHTSVSYTQNNVQSGGSYYKNVGDTPTHIVRIVGVHRIASA